MSDILNALARVILAIPEPSIIVANMTAPHKHDGEREVEINRVQSLALNMVSHGTWHVILFVSAST